MKTGPIYLDHAATTPVDPAVRKAMRPYLKGSFGNPSSAHGFGGEAREALRNAREETARLLGVGPDELVFTASGSEADNLALKGVAWALRSKGNHIITTSVEHHAVIEPCRFLEELGFRVTYLPVDGFGRIDPDDVRRAITAETVLVSVMHANNEVGTVQPIAETARIAREREVLFHTDAVQTFGTVPLGRAVADIDLFSASAHKFYGPKGVGLLFVKRGTPLVPLVHGGAQEQRRRAGTENMAGILGLAAAARLALGRAEAESVRLARLRDRLVEGIAGAVDGAILNGHPRRRLPNNVSFCIDGVEGESLVLELSERGVAASSGSACSSGSAEPSHVLKAMGVPAARARGAVRFSLGKSTDDEAVDRVLDVFPKIVRRLRGITAVPVGLLRRPA